MEQFFYRSYKNRILTWLILVCFVQTFILSSHVASAASNSFTSSIRQKNKRADQDLPIAACLEVTSNSIPFSSLKEISDNVCLELKNSKKFSVYSRQEIQQLLNHTLNEEKIAARQIDQFVKEAKRLYEDFKFKAAASVMGEAMKVIPLFDASPHILHNISEAYLTEALIFFALEKEEETKISFLNAAVLEPTRTLDPLLYPPSVIKKFNQAKKEFSHIQEGSLRIESNPPVAEVFVGEKRQGTTPVTLTNLPLGVQKVRIVKAGHDSWEKHLMVVSSRSAKESERYVNRVNINLNKMGSNVSLNALMGELISRKTLDLQFSKMADIGKLLFTDVVFATRIERSKNEKGYDLYIAYVDSKTEAILGKGYAKASSNLSDLSSALSHTLQEMFRRIFPQKFTDLIAVEPKGANYLTSYNKKKPFYKRWYFYVPLGVVVAGGGAGAAIFLSKSSGPSGGSVSAVGSSGL